MAWPMVANSGGTVGNLAHDSQDLKMALPMTGKRWLIWAIIERCEDWHSQYQKRTGKAGPLGGHILPSRFQYWACILCCLGRGSPTSTPNQGPSHSTARRPNSGLFYKRTRCIGRSHISQSSLLHRLRVPMLPVLPWPLILYHLNATRPSPSCLPQPGGGCLSLMRRQ